MKTLKNILLAGITSTLVSFSNPIETQAQELSYGPRIGFSPRQYSLSLNESKDIPVHPDDAKFLHGTTEIKAESTGAKSCAINFGGEIRETWNNGLSIFGGLDLELEITSSGPNGQIIDTSEMYSMVQQSSDKRNAAFASFVYDRLDPDQCSLIPFLGAGIRSKKYFADLEYSLATRNFKREWGHHRYGKEQSIGSEKYSTSGNRIGLKLGIIQEYGFLLGLQLAYEDYNLKKFENNVGELKSYAAGLFMKKEF